MVVTVTDDHGRRFEGEADLRLVGEEREPRGRGVKRGPRAKGSHGSGLDFELPRRAFVKKYSSRTMSGAQKFVLLLASLAKGKTDVTIPVQDLQRAWGSMTERMGGKFNPAYTTRAKDNGWINTPKKGVYELRASWREIFKE